MAGESRQPEPGQMFLLHNADRKLGVGREYWGGILEYPLDSDERKHAGSRIAVLFAPGELETAIRRARKDPELVQQLLSAHSATAKRSVQQ